MDKMSTEELGYFLYMEEMERRQQEQDGAADAFGDAEADENGEQK